MHCKFVAMSVNKFELSKNELIIKKMCFMKNLKKLNVQELNVQEQKEIEGGGFFSFRGSLFRSAAYIGVSAIKGSLAVMGVLAGLGDGLRKGMGN